MRLYVLSYIRILLIGALITANLCIIALLHYRRELRSGPMTAMHPLHLGQVLMNHHRHLDTVEDLALHQDSSRGRLSSSRGGSSDRQCCMWAAARPSTEGSKANT